MSSERYLFLIKGSLVMAQPLAAPEALELLEAQQPGRRVHSEFFFPLLALCQIQKPTQK